MEAIESGSCPAEPGDAEAALLDGVPDGSLDLTFIDTSSDTHSPAKGHVSDTLSISDGLHSAPPLCCMALIIPFVYVRLPL